MPVESIVARPTIEEDDPKYFDFKNDYKTAIHNKFVASKKQKNYTSNDKILQS